ncbi:hypothetical protein BH09MYX1_BH09MYX1_60750 [soil metagenome]
MSAALVIDAVVLGGTILPVASVLAASVRCMFRSMAQGSNPSVPSAEPPTEALPRTLDRYELLSVLGSGAFATVYRGRHVHTEQLVAGKVLQRREGTTRGVERWLSEARAMAAVQHPNVVRVLDCGRAASGEAFLVMELAECGTLEAMLEGRTLPIATAIRLAAQMLDGLESAHGKGIVHRDVKPPNVLVTHDETGSPVAKLLDFGVSKIATPGRAAGTLPGTAMGTPGYMAPELFGDAANADARADVYGVAATLFEMLAGRLPFIANSYEDLLVQVRTERPPSLKVIAPHVPPQLAEIVDRGLARDRDARWPSARAFSDALLGSVSASMVPSRPELDATMDARLPPPPQMPGAYDPHAAIARTDPPAHSTLKSNPPPVSRTTMRSSESKSRFGLILAIVGGLLVIACVAGGALVYLQKGSTSAGIAASTPAPREKKDSTMETHDVDRMTAVGGLPFDPDGDTVPNGVENATGDPVKDLKSPRGMSFTALPSVTNHVTDGSLAAFGRAVVPRAQLCRPIAAATTVVIELLVNSGEIGIAQIAAGNKGDKLVAQCVASAFKEVSDKGGRLSGEGIVQVLVAIEPR